MHVSHPEGFLLRFSQGSASNHREGLLNHFITPHVDMWMFSSPQRSVVHIWWLSNEGFCCATQFSAGCAATHPNITRAAYITAALTGWPEKPKAPPLT